MIDALKDEVLSLSEVAGRLPKLGGKPVHPTTLTRWIVSGVRGVKLEGVRIGNSWGTTLDAVKAFLDACSGKSAPPKIDTAANERAKRRLELAGF